MNQMTMTSRSKTQQASNNTEFLFVWERYIFSLKAAYHSELMANTEATGKQVPAKTRRWFPVGPRSRKVGQ